MKRENKKENIVHISFKKDLSKSYMVVENVRAFSEQDFMVKMLFRNSIPQLLSAESETLNGRINMLYDISSKQALFKLFETGKMTFAQVRNLIFSLRFLLRTLEEYLLDENNIILKKECIFTDPEGENYEFCYYPYYNGNLALELKELFSVLFSLIDYEDEKVVRLVQEVHKETQRDNFTIDTLLSAYENVSENGLCVVEKPDPDGNCRPLLPEPKDPFPSGEAESYEDDATFLERAKFYLKGKNPLDVLEDINRGGILEKIRQCGRAPEVEKALEPSSLPLPVKPAFEYIMLHEEQDGELAEESRYHSSSSYLQRENSVSEQRWLEGRKSQRGIEYAIDHFPLTIGKAEGSDVRITAAKVSQLHARLHEEKGQLFLEDLNSENGTYLNGTPLCAYQKRPVKEGDILRFAREEFCLR